MNNRSGTTTQPLRSMNMNPYGSQQGPQTASRQTPRLQNKSQTSLGNGTGGWGGFGMQSPGGAFSGLGAAPGLSGGQGRPGQLSGFAQVMGGGSGQGPIDMSDFPSLSGGPRPPQQQQQSNANAASWNSNAIRQPSSQQPPQPQQSQQRAPSAAPSHQSSDQFDGRAMHQQATERSGSGDDFPPLGGQMNGGLQSQANGFGSGFGSPDMQQSRPNGQQTQLPIREGSGGYQQNALGPQLSQQQSHPLQNGAPPPSSGVKRYADMTDSEKWGLPGLMAAYEARRQIENGGQVDETLPPGIRSTLVMGHDLNSLGMDLDSPEPLYPTFSPFPAVGSAASTTFDFHDRHTVPDFTLPSAYTVTNVPPLSSRMSAFSDETLFSIFYQNPRDVTQELAASELINRDWRWHKVLRKWLQKDTRESNGSSSLQLIDLTNGAPIGALPQRKSDRVESGVYVFFDAPNWRRERQYLDLDYESLDPPRVSAMAGGPGGGPALGGPMRMGTGEGVQQSGVASSQVPGA